MEKEKLELPYHWSKLAPVQTAVNYFQEGERGIPYIQEALKIALENTGQSDPCVREIIVDSADLKSLQRAAQIYLKRYNEGASQQTVGDFVQYNWSILEDYLENDKEKFNKDLEEFKNMKYVDFNKEKDKLETIVKSHERHKLHSKQEYENAKKALEKYENMWLLPIAQQKSLEPLNKQVEDRVIKRERKAHYAKRNEQEKEQEARAN